MKRWWADEMSRGLAFAGFRTRIQEKPTEWLPKAPPGPRSKRMSLLAITAVDGKSSGRPYFSGSPRSWLSVDLAMESLIDEYLEFYARR